MPDPILKIENLNAYYKDFQALYDVNLHAEEGEVLAIIGANGAGKTTLMRSISGLIANTNDQVVYRGNKIGAMNPNTMEVRYYNLPDKRTRVRRLDLDSQGNVWYVNSTRGKIGRLNPDTGAITEWDSPSGTDSHPYALAVIDDIIWYNESGMRPDAIVRFDPKAETFQSWAIPSGVGIIRNVWVTEEENLLIHQSSTNQVGLVRIN